MTAPSTEVRRRPWELWTAPIVVAVLLLLGLVVWTSCALAAIVAGDPLPGHPARLLVRLLLGREHFGGVAAGGVGIWAAVFATLAILLLRRKLRQPRARVDSAVRHLGRHKELGHLTSDGAATKADQLRRGGAGKDPAGHGVLIGRTVDRHADTLRQSYEDVSIDIHGPRRGKTSARAIPAILDAPGCVVATSNKADLFDATWLPRSTRGPVWVFDPQRIVLGEDREARHCWFNPLAQVHSITDAEALVGIFRAAETARDMKSDAFFSNAGDQLLATLFLAAARSGRHLVHVYRWLLAPGEEEPLELLRTHVSEDPVQAERLEANMLAPDKQRAGVYAEAIKLMRVVADPARAEWVIPGAGPRFDPVGFVMSGNSTLYLMSEEGPGSCGALVAAVVKAIGDVARRCARREPNRRLDPPLVCVLDETANVCRLPDLPSYYSYFGSHGIVLMTFLQSYHQGVGCWGSEGMSILWDASTVNVYGGGVSDTKFLDQLSQLAGEHEVLQWSASRGHKTRTLSETRTRERTLSVADLGSLDPWRAFILAGVSRPTVIELVPWWRTHHEQTIRESIARRNDAAELLIGVTPGRRDDQAAGREDETA